MLKARRALAVEGQRQLAERLSAVGSTGPPPEPAEQPSVDAGRRSWTRPTPTNRFFDHMVGVPGWQKARLTVVAQAVQRSGAPEACQRWEVGATELATAPDGATGHSSVCT